MLHQRIIFLAISLCALPGVAGAAACSKANLTRCLDSACAINISSNPAARCQYCGTSDAGEPPSTKAMKSVSVGASSKNTISDKELKSAPTDPGERYMWASAECLKKLSDCDTDDVEEIYDPLIEQSCRAAGINSQMAALQEKARQTRTQSSCKADISACVVAAGRCGADYRSCADEAAFDKFFAECAVEATGCDEYSRNIRTELFAAHNDAIKNSDAAVTKVVKAYQEAREKKIASIKDSCRANTGREQCIANVCERSMANNCEAGYESEMTMAIALCKFYDVACATVD